MKARIINGTDWGGNHTQEWIDNNQDIKFAGQLVSEWELVELLPTEELKLKKWNGTSWYEGLTEQDIYNENIQKAIKIDFEYTHKIDDLMTKHFNKVTQAIYFNTTYVIPQTALNEMQALKDECNAKIAELGITDYTYRQSVPKLAKTETLNK